MVDSSAEGKRRGRPLVVWLLLLVALAVAAWYLLAFPDSRRLRITSAMPAPGETRTSLDQIAADPAGSAGQPIILAGVQVVAALGRSGLLVADDAGNRIFVTITQAMPVAEGKRVTITGTITAGDDSDGDEAGRPVGMPADTSHYIVASRVELAGTAR